MTKEKQKTTVASENAAQDTREKLNKEVFETGETGEEEIIGIETDDISEEMCHFGNNISELMSYIGMTSASLKMFKAEKERMKKATDEEEKKYFERKANFFLENYYAAYENAEEHLAELLDEEELSESGGTLLRKAVKIIDQLVVAILRKGHYGEINKLLFDSGDRDALRYVIASIFSDEEE